MGQNPRWVSVTAIMQHGIGEFIGGIYGNPDLEPHAAEYIGRLNRIDTIKNTELHIEDVTGEDKTVDVVVDIFNRVNSAGTTLSKGDLALAKVCASWPEARTEMTAKLGGWRDAGFNFKLEWLLRCVNSIVLQLQKCGEEFQAASAMAAPGRCLVPPPPPGPPQR